MDELELYWSGFYWFSEWSWRKQEFSSFNYIVSQWQKENQTQRLFRRHFKQINKIIEIFAWPWNEQPQNHGSQPVIFIIMYSMEIKIDLDIEQIQEGVFQATSQSMEGVAATGNTISEAINKAMELALELAS